MNVNVKQRIVSAFIVSKPNRIRSNRSIMIKRIVAHGEIMKRIVPLSKAAHFSDLNTGIFEIMQQQKRYILHL